MKELADASGLAGRPPIPGLVLIEWLDSRQPTGCWAHLSDLKELDACHCVSVGFLVSDGDVYKVLAPNMADVHDDEGAQATGVIVIPASSVKRVVHLVKADDAPHD